MSMIDLANKVQIRLKSFVTRKYLRLCKFGGVDAAAGRSPDSVFMVHRIDANLLKLQSCEDPTRWLQCREDGTVDDKGKGGKSCVFMIKHHEKNLITLSPQFNIDWHIGVTETGKIKNASEVPHDSQALFKIELISCQILRDEKMSGNV